MSISLGGFAVDENHSLFFHLLASLLVGMPEAGIFFTIDSFYEFEHTSGGEFNHRTLAPLIAVGRWHAWIFGGHLDSLQVMTTTKLIGDELLNSQILVI